MQRLALAVGIAVALLLLLLVARGPDSDDAQTPESPWKARALELHALVGRDGFWPKANELWAMGPRSDELAGDWWAGWAAFKIARNWAVEGAPRPAGTTAVEWLERATAIAEEVDDNSRCDVAELWADHHERRGDRELAVAALVRAADDERNANALALPWLLLRLAEMRRVEWRWSEARGLLDRAEAALHEDDASHDALRPEIHGVRAQVLLDMGLPDRAARWIEAEAASAGPDESARQKVARLWHRANLALAVEDYAGIIELLESEPLHGLYESGRAQLEWRRAYALLRLEQLDPNREPIARERLAALVDNSAAQSADRVHAMLLLGELDTRAGRLAEAERWLDRAAPLVARETDGGLVHAIHAALVARLALARGTGADELETLGNELDATVQGLLDRWSATRREGGVAFLHSKRRRTPLAASMEVHLARGETERALLVLVRALGLGTLAREIAGGAQPPEPTLAELRAAFCGERRGLLFYLPDVGRGRVFALDREGLVHEPLVSDIVLDEQRRRLTGALFTHPAKRPEAQRGPFRAVLDEIAADTGGLLLPGVVGERVAQWEEVTIVGIDALGYLPFETLRPGGGTALGQRLAIGYLGSPALGAALAERADRAPRTSGPELFLCAAPAHGSAIAKRWPLVDLAWDADREKRLIGDQRALVIHGPNATLSALLEGCRAGPRVLHVLAHGVYDWTRLEWPAGLILAAESGRAGDVWWEDLGALSAPPLVVLSACGAARSPLRRGEDGIHHLGGAFLLRGAQAVVLSHGDLDYDATLAFMGEFHASLADGASPARALLDARRAVAADPRWEHPFFHSSIHVRGLGHRPLFER